MEEFSVRGGEWNFTVVEVASAGWERESAKGAWRQQAERANGGRSKREVQVQLPLTIRNLRFF